MKSITTKPDKQGWNYTFRKNKDGTIVIQQKNNKSMIYRSIDIVGEGVLDALCEVIEHVEEK